MSKPQEIALIEFYIASSLKALQSAKSLYDLCDNNGAMNRLYYSCYYSAFAILLLKHKIRTKTHSGLFNMFSLHFIKTGIIAKLYGDLFITIMQRRSEADYGDFVLITNDELDELIPLTEKFIDEIKKLIQC
jgi:uncharacterized protein